MNARAVSDLTNPMRQPRREILCGFPLDALSMRDTLDVIAERFDRGLATSISVINVAKLVNMRQDSLLRESVLTGDIILADGAPLVWLSRFKGAPLPERVAGIDLMYELLRFASLRHLRVFFLGAKFDVVLRVVELARRDFPHLEVAGWHDGYFSDDEQASIAAQVRDTSPDILLVGMSSPKKEIFLKRWTSVMNVPICHGVGGSFDVMAGVTRRAPCWMQRCGLEWFYRVVQEPRRMWKRYLITNAVFLGLALRELLMGTTARSSRSDLP